MKHEPCPDTLHKAPAIQQFSGVVGRSIQRATHSSIRLRKASWDRLQPVLEDARKAVALTDDDTIRRVLVHNPDIARLIHDRRTDADIGLFAYLPLNARGAMAIVSGGLDGAAPDTDLICRPDEAPTAVYTWLVHAPGNLARAINAIFACVDELAPEGCPLFSRAVNPHSQRLQRRMGFRPAQDRYPGAPEWLIMTEPGGSASREDRPSGQKIEVRCVRTIDEFMQVATVRSSVYIAEQLCRYEEEFDGNDFCGTQFLGLVDGDAAGCARLRYFGGFAKLERIAVRPQYRTSNLAAELMRTAIEHCRRKGFRKIYGHARHDLIPYYQRFGCQPAPGRPPFSFANIEYQEMTLDLEPHQDAIDIDSDPLILIRQEGYWEDLGPLELSIAASTNEQHEAVQQNIRRFRG
ncbi:MAG: GNAT family N-acetyltransferase [Pseudomonadota bacterium]